MLLKNNENQAGPASELVVISATFDEIATEK